VRPLDAIRGYAIVFGARSQPIDDEAANGRPYIETIEHAAAVYWLRSHCHLNLAHQPRNAIGNTANETMRVWRDKTGVAFEVDLPRTNEGVGWRQMMASRHDWGASGSFKWFGRTVDGDGEERIERVTRCRLEHISITETPAYPATAAWLASMPGERMSPHIRASALRWNCGKRCPIEDPVPNPEYKFDYATKREVRMSAEERRQNYRALCEMADRARTWSAA
jgi:phage head maturation protease